MRRINPAHVAVLVILALIALGVGAVLLDEDHPPPAVTVAVDGPDRDRARDDQITVPTAAIQAPAASDVGDHEDSRSENPPGVTPSQLDKAREQQEALARDDQLPAVTPDAAPAQRGCTSRFISTYSSRRGVAPRLFVVHYTVSPNRTGWDDVNAIVALFSRVSFQASSHYVVDAEGHCAYIVRESDKAWTQVTFNPVSVSVEVVNSGHETSLAGTAGLARLGQVISDATSRWKIPLQQGAVSGCTVTRPGIVDHHTLGACGGGHVDISPYPLSQVLAAARAARTPPPPPVRAVDRDRCKRLVAWRRAGRPKGGLWEQHSITRRKLLTVRKLTCDAKGVHRAR